MKYFVLSLCLVLGTSSALPIESPQASAADLFTWLETLVEYEGIELLTKVAHLIKQVEDGIQRVKELVPKTYSKIHEDADKILDELKEVTKDFADFLAKKGGDVHYGFGILDEITDLTGGTKLGTIMRVLQLAESANKVCQDAKEFQPKLEKEMNKVQGIIEKHIDDLTTHILNELGLGGNAQKSIVKDIKDLFENLGEKPHKIILTLLKDIEDAFNAIEREVPEVYKVVGSRIEEIRAEIRSIIKELRDSVQKDFYHGFGILDEITDLTGGTKLGTIMRVLQLAESANKVCQDAKEFQPKLGKEMDKVQKIIEKHMDDLTTHILNELGLDGDAQKSIVKDIDDLFENLGEKVHKIILTLLKDIEDAFNTIEREVPEVYKVVGSRIEEIRAEIRSILKELRDSVQKDVYYGFGILDEITDLTGGTKLGTVMRVLQLAESANKVYQDAKEFQPKLQKEMDKVQGIVEKHMDDLTTHILNELGLGGDAQKSIVKDTEDLFENLKDKAHKIILTLLKAMGDTFSIIEKELPEVYKVIEKRIEEIRDEIRSILQELHDSIQQGVPYGILDIAGSLTKGTTLGTVIRIVNVMQKFTVVIQDCRGFGPHVEVLLEHSVEKVAVSAKEFFSYAAEIMLTR